MAATRNAAFQGKRWVVRRVTCFTDMKALRHFYGCRQLLRGTGLQSRPAATGHQLLSALNPPKSEYHATQCVWIKSSQNTGHETKHVSKCCFHTSPQRFVPPIFWIFIKPVAKLGAILSGRGVRKWWGGLPDEQRHHFRGRVKQNWYWFVVGALGLGGAALVYYETHLEETPITGRKRFIVVTHDQFQKIAAAEAAQQMEEFKDKMLPPDHPMAQRVLRIGQRLLQANPEVQKLVNFEKWKVVVIQDPKTINAFVLPTGQIFVFTGILDFASNDDQLAVVIAHEMAHAILSHGIEQVSYAQLLDFTIIAAMAAIWCILPTDGLAVITQWFYNKFLGIMLHMPYSRKLEKEADKVGLQLAAKACYDVREGSVFWSRMQLMEDATDSEDSIPEWLSTHPSHQKRVELLDFLIPRALEARTECQCPNLSSKDPRDAIKELSSLVDNHRTAKKAGQNLNRVTQHIR